MVHGGGGGGENGEKTYSYPWLLMKIRFYALLKTPVASYVY